MGAFRLVPPLNQTPHYLDRLGPQGSRSLRLTYGGTVLARACPGARHKKDPRPGRARRVFDQPTTESTNHWTTKPSNQRNHLTWPKLQALPIRRQIQQRLLAHCSQWPQSFWWTPPQIGRGPCLCTSISGGMAAAALGFAKTPIHRLRRRPANAAWTQRTCASQGTG